MHTAASYPRRSFSLTELRARLLSVGEGYPVQCVEFLDSLMMKAVNQAGSAGIKYAERDSLFFSTSREVSPRRLRC